MSAKLWSCSECGAKYDSPVNITGFLCGHKSQHTSGKPVSMTPVTGTTK